MIGYYGDIIFETSDKKILNFDGMTYEAKARFAAHDVIGKKPKTEYVGPDLDQIRYTINLNGKYGVKPRDEMERWISIANNGEAHPLVIGGKALGEDRWVVKSVSEAWDTIYNDGKLFSGKIDVSFEEYISEM